MENPDQAQIECNTDDSLKSFARIKEYPVIKDSFLIAGEYYNWIKDKSGTITSTLNWTENIVKDVVHKVEPIAASQLESLDKYACTKLDTLESKYPIVKEPSSEVLKSSSEYYEANIKSRVESAKDSVTYIATAPIRITTQTIEKISSTANNFVGKYLSATSPVDSNDSSTTIGNTSYDTTFRNAVKEIDVIRNYTMSNVQTLTNLLSAIYSKTVTNNEEWMKRYYEEFRTELDSTSSSQAVSSSSPTDTNSKLMELAIHLSNKMRISVRAMSTVCYNHLSVDYREKLDLVFAKTEQLYSNVNKSTFETLREKISMENVQWIGATAFGIMNVLKEIVVQKYKDTTGKDSTAELEISETHETDGPTDGHE